mgnify:FL=1
MIGNEPSIWREVTSSLLGTDEFLDDVLKEFGVEALENFAPFMEFLETVAFCCVSCGFWFDPCEESETDATCKECNHE